MQNLCTLCACAISRILTPPQRRSGCGPTCSNWRHTDPFGQRVVLRAGRVCASAYNGLASRRWSLAQPANLNSRWWHPLRPVHRSGFGGGERDAGATRRSTPELMGLPVDLRRSALNGPQGSGRSPARCGVGGSTPASLSAWRGAARPWLAAPGEKRNSAMPLILPRSTALDRSMARLSSHHAGGAGLGACVCRAVSTAWTLTLLAQVRRTWSNAASRSARFEGTALSGAGTAYNCVASIMVPRVACLRLGRAVGPK